MFIDKILGPIKQWGYLVQDLDDAIECWVKQLGIGPWWGYKNVQVTSYYGEKKNQISMSVGLSYHQGIQIELIQQLDSNPSPYQYFYQRGTEAQALQQVAYMVPDIDVAIAQCQQRGMHEVGRILPAPDLTYVYMSSPGLAGLAIELMPHDQNFLDDYERSSLEAEKWDGNNPFRLIEL